MLGKYTVVVMDWVVGSATETNSLVWSVLHTWRSHELAHFPEGTVNPKLYSFVGQHTTWNFQCTYIFPPCHWNCVSDFIHCTTHSRRLLWPQITIWHYHLARCVPGRVSDSQLHRNRKWKYGGNHIYELAAINFLFNFNTIYGYIGHHFHVSYLEFRKPEEVMADIDRRSKRL